MAFCHGRGNPPDSHCCWVEGQVCPHYRTGPSLTALVNSYSGPRKSRAQTQAQGVTHACRIAIDVIANDSSAATNRATLNAKWDVHPDYLVSPRPAWERIEQANGLPVDSYQCSTWGPGTGQCCFAESTSVNESKAGVLNAAAVTIRRAGGE